MTPHLIGNALTFAMGTLFGWLPWKVAAVFAVLSVLLVLAFSRLFDWSDIGGATAVIPYLPGLILGAALGIYLRRRT